MEKVKFKDITINMDNRRKPLNSIDREKISDKKLYPYCGANAIMDYVDEYIFDEEILCIAEDGGKWGKNEDCSYIMREKCWVNNHAHVIKGTDKVDIRYLKYWLNYNDLNSQITGAIVRKLTQKALNELEIILPKKDEQAYICNTFDKIQEIIDIKMKQIEELEELIKALFVDMFKQKNYDKKCLNDISIIKGEYGSGASAGEYIKGQPRYVRITDIQEDGRLNNNSIASPKNENNLEKYTLDYGDILFARTGATVGKTYKYSADDGYCIYAGYCIRFRLDLEKVNPDYIFTFTKTDEYRKWVANKQRVVAQPNINAKEYGNDLLIPIPPIELQNRFAEFVKIIDKQKFEIQKSLEETQRLQKSLMSKYFE